jgi:hypothetical protein
MLLSGLSVSYVLIGADSGLKFTPTTTVPNITPVTLMT